ncbi:hypothetical protein [Cellulomonas terrae]|uniref:hypothetical protein n=1 Tax=Cellulomonas terrae TaxID=311234 RepID=UPI001FEBFA33|nr:hypothetical protein [Cellulomonas terrae]
MSTGDLIELHGCLCVRASGKHPRIVPITAPHDETLRRIAAADPGSTLLGMDPSSWTRSRLDRITQRVALPADCPRIVTHRLRSTWVRVHLEHQVDLGGLARMAAVTSGKFFENVIPYLRPVADDELFATMARQ